MTSTFLSHVYYASKVHTKIHCILKIGQVIYTIFTWLNTVATITHVVKLDVATI